MVSFRLWVRKVGPWHSRWKSLPRDPKKGVGGVRDSRDGVPKRVSDSRDRGLRSQRASKSSRPGLSNETGRVKAFGRNPVDLYLSSVTGRLKATGSQLRPGLSSPSDCQDSLGLLVKLRNPPDTVGSAGATRSRFSRWLLGPKRSAAQEVVSPQNSTRAPPEDCETLREFRGSRESPGDCRPEEACCTRGRFSAHRAARP